VPVRIGRGGPPWMTSSTTTANSSAVTPPAGTGAEAAQGGAAQGQGAGQGSGQGAGQNQPQATSTETWWQALDWKVIILITTGLATAFSLILMGYSSLKKTGK
jgi:hypothetical protein